MPRSLTAPMTKETIQSLKAGDRVLLSGVIYTGRDAAHKRLQECLTAGQELPFPIEGTIMYYVGPTPEAPGQVIGSAGPTTSYRMDAYTPALLDRGLAGMIGKGKRNQAVIDAIIRNQAVYFGAVGGAGALLSQCIKKSTIIAYEDLGPEAIRRLEVENMPLVVIIDSQGNNLYETGPAEYLRLSATGHD